MSVYRSEQEHSVSLLRDGGRDTPIYKEVGVKRKWPRSSDGACNMALYVRQVAPKQKFLPRRKRKSVATSRRQFEQTTSNTASSKKCDAAILRHL